MGNVYWFKVYLVGWGVNLFGKVFGLKYEDLSWFFRINVRKGDILEICEDRGRFLGFFW